MDGARPVRAPRGTTRLARSWQTEAPLRMLMNNLDPENAERPDDLVVYGGTGRAARSWGAFDAMVATLRDLRDDETMLVQSGKPVGVMRTHEWAPRVLLANSNLVGDWATWPEFRRLEALGLTMYGQMTAGSWIYIGTQGIVQGTYETFAAAADALAARRGGAPGATLAGTLTVTGGCGGMGGAQPLAVTLNGGVCLVVDVDAARLLRRVEHRYLDEVAPDLDAAVARVERARRDRQALSVGVVGNCATVLPELLRRGVEADLVTDQTSAHDPLSYLPVGVEVADWHDYAAAKPEEFTDRARASMAAHVEAMVGYLDAGAEVFDYGNSIRDEARQGGYDRAFAFPGFVPAYIRPLFTQGRGPFRWAALSGDPRDIHATDAAVLELFPDDERLATWIRAARERIAFQGLPARICWLGYGERDVAGARFNDMVARGQLSAPLVIGRDHLDCGSVASPYRETESMADGSDAIADWPLLNALVNTASGATWVSIHHGGGVGIGRSIHAGQVTVADGSELAGQKLNRVLTNDPGMGVIRHIDSGDATDPAGQGPLDRHPRRWGERADGARVRWFADVALLPQGPARGVLLTVDDGRFTAVVPSAERPADAVLLPGVVVPGFANCHSHAFHRALRGRTHGDGGTFWTWRGRMYALAAQLDPDSYLALARAAYAEMALAGVTAVGEFHYLRHGPGGVPYDDPNQMALSLRQAAREAGVRLTLLDACYLSGGLDERGHLPLDPVQRRFADADAHAWAARRERLVGAVGGREGPGAPAVLVGAAIHSVRAVPRHALRAVAEAARGVPLHVHASEQPAENAACLAVHGLTPVGLLAAEGVLGPRTSVVHATHLTDADTAVLGATRTTACFCPTTERDLADGIGPARALLDAGAPLSLGSDSHAVVDLLEEARALESHERLASLARGRFSPAQLVAALTAHASIGWDDAGTLAVGARADLVAVRTDTVRTAGAEPAQVLYAASAADVDTVVVDGAVVVSGGRHVLGDVGRLLADAIEPLWAG